MSMKKVEMDVCRSPVEFNPMEKFMTYLECTSHNKDHVYAVEMLEDGHYQSVFPEPLADMSHGHSSEKQAYYYLLDTKLCSAGGENWRFDNPVRAAKLLCEDIREDIDDANPKVLKTGWLCHESGAPLSEVWRTLQEEIWDSRGEPGEFAATNDQLRIAKDLWSDLGDTHIDHDGRILEDWMFFKAGTHRHLIWHWLEETLDVVVAQDLM